MRPIVNGFLILLFLLSNKGFSQEAPFLVKLERDNLKKIKEVHKYDLTKGISSKLYQITKDYGKDLRVSPNDKFIALIETTKGVVEGHEFKILPRNSLTILNSQGKVFYSLNEDVRQYVWSPDGEKIAFIAGSYHEGGIGFSIEGLYYFNLLTKKKTKITNVDYPYRIYWSTNGELYIRNLWLIDEKSVFKFDFSSGKLTATDYYDIHFSPNEKYYVHYPDEGDIEFRMFETRTNREITNSIPSGLGRPSKWVLGRDSFFLFINQEVELDSRTSNKRFKIIKSYEKSTLTIFDVEQKSVAKVIKDVDKNSWIGNNSVLPFVKAGKINTENLSN